MLLTHTSSIKDNWEVLEPLYTVNEGGDSPLQLDTFVQGYLHPKGNYFDSEKNFFNEQPGNYWEYSNMGYALLGLIIQNVSGKEFSKYMKEEIFLSLKMHNSYWFLRNIPHNNIAKPHELPTGKNDSIKILKHYGYPSFPDGQLRTTVTDYLKFVKLILDNGKIDKVQFIKKEIIEQFHTVQFPNVHKYQAVAWNYNEFENWLYYRFMKRLPSHTGGDPGVATVVSFDPERKIAAVVFMNSPPVTFKGGKILYFDLLKKKC